jgi:hypothetical protein
MTGFTPLKSPDAQGRRQSLAILISLKRAKPSISHLLSEIYPPSVIQKGSSTILLPKTVHGLSPRQAPAQAELPL